MKGLKAFGTRTLTAESMGALVEMWSPPRLHLASGEQKLTGLAGQGIPELVFLAHLTVYAGAGRDCGQPYSLTVLPLGHGVLGIYGKRCKRCIEPHAAQ
ncbi:MAG: hypothetical protein C1O27_002128 [Chloroflexi bacterium]|nr:MAG: hypothetical protein C1O27_002128 [Chloroflexota bacterium]